MAVVGSAFVEIHAIMTAVTEEIRAGLSGATAGQGELAGSKFAREFGAAAEAGIAGPLATMRAEVNSAFEGGAAGVSDYTAATITAKAANGELAAATRLAVSAQREYTLALQEQALAQQEESALLERSTVLAQESAAARVAAAREVALASQQELVSATEAALAEAQSSVQVTAAQEEATAARLAAAQEATAAAAEEVAAANAAAAGAVEAVQREVAALAEANAARVASADAARTAAAAQMEASAAAAAAATRSAEESAAANVTAARGFEILKTATMGITLVAAAVGVAGIKMAADFQSATERLVTSAGETQANLDGVRTGILNLAGQVGYSAADLAAAMYKIESGGQHGAAGLDVLKAAAEGAKTENADLTTVSDALTSALTDYHLPASAAADVTSKLVAATSAGKLSFQDLAGSLSAVLPIASANHVSLNDILGDLSSMTLHGISAQQATQNLSDVIKHMAAPTAVQSKELATLGINSQNLANDLGTKGLSGTLQEVAQAIQKDMGPGSTKVIVDLQTALHNLPPAVQDLGKKLIDGSISLKDYTKAAKELDPISASQALSFKTLATNFYQVGNQQVTGQAAMQSYTDALRRATGDATGLNVALMLTGENSGNTTGAIKTVSDATAEAGGHVRGWADIQSTFNVTFAQFKDGIGAGAIAVGTKLLPVLTALLQGIMGVTSWFSQHQAIAGTLSVILGVVLANAVAILSVKMATNLVGAIKSVGAAFQLMNANPVVLALTAIIVVVYLLITHWTEVQAVLTTVWNAISSTATTVWGAIASFFTGIWNSMVGIATGVWNGIAGFFSGLWTNIQNIFTTAVNAVSSFLQQWGPTILAVIAPVIGIPLLISQNWDTIVAFFQNLWNNVVSAFNTGVTNVVNFFSNLPNNIAYALGALAGILVSAAVNGTVAFARAVVDGVNATIDFFARLPLMIFNAVVGLSNFLRDVAVNGALAFANAIATGFNATIAWFVALPGVIGNALLSFGTFLVNAAVAGAAAFGNAIVNGFNVTIAWFQSLPALIGNYFTGLATSFNAWAAAAMVSFYTGVLNGFNATIAWLQSLPGAIAGFFVNAGTWLLNVGGDIINGFVNGLVNGTMAVVNFFTGLVDSFIQGFKDHLDIHSPSGVFMQFGMFILQGLVQGLQNMLSAVIAFVQFIASSIVAGFNAFITGITAQWTAFWNLLVSVATTVFESVNGFITTVWNNIVTIFNFSIGILSGAWNLMWTTIFNVVSTIWNSVVSFLTTAVQAVVVFFTTAWNNELAFWNTLWANIVSIVTTMWNNIVSFLTNAVNAVVSFFTTAWNNELAFWTGLWNSIVSVATSLWNNIVSFLTNAVNNFINFFTTIWNAELAVWNTIWNNISTTATTIWNNISSFLTDAFNTFSAFFSNIWNNIVSVFTTIWNTIKTTAMNLWNAISSFFTTAYAAELTAWNNLWNTVSSVFSNIWNGIVSTAKTIWDNIVSTVKSGVNLVIDAINGITGGIDVVLNFVGITPGISPIPRLAAGGRVGGGFMTDGPAAIVGEGNPAYPEFVIPTDPQFKKRAASLFMALGQQLSDSGSLAGAAPQMASGGKVQFLAAGGVIGDIASWITGDDSGIKADADTAVRAVTGGNKAAEDIGVGGVNKIIDGAESMIKKAYDAMQAALAAAASALGLSGPGGAPTVGGDLLAWITTAENLTGVGSSWTAGLSTLIMRESGGNPNAINLTDSNAAAGHPSQGLMQTIPSTFAAYHQPGTSNSITDPVANIAAGINYIKARYGGIGNVQQANPNLPPKGYDSGGWLPPGITLTNNSSGVPEAIIPDPMTAFRTSMLDVFSRLAPELMMAISAGSRDQAQSLAMQLELNPDRLAAIGQALSQQLGVPIDSVSSAINDLVSAQTNPTTPTTPSGPPPTPPTPPQSPAQSPAARRIEGFMEEVSEHLSGSVQHFINNIQDCSNGIRASQLADHVTDLAERFGLTVESVDKGAGTQASTVTHGPGGDGTTDGIAGLSPEKRGANTGATITPGALDAIVANYGNNAPAAGSAAQQAAQAAADAQVAASDAARQNVYPDGAFQVHVHGNADSVTIGQLQDTMSEWGKHILSSYRARK